MKATQVSENEAFDRIAMAIVRQAAEDYQRVYNQFLKDGTGERELRNLERWFKSWWGQTCSFGLGEVIMEKIRNGEDVFANESINQEI